MFEKRAMFEPIVPVPTLRIFEAKILGVERAFEANTFPVTWNVGPPVAEAAVELMLKEVLVIR
jgi:hypothetical protein